MDVKTIFFVLLAACGIVAHADRIELRLSDWTCDGVAVSVPHTWNVIDGADGQGAYPTDKDNSVAGHGYLRTCKTYATNLPNPKSQKRYFVHCGGAAVRDRVNGQAFVVFASHYWWQNKGDGDRWIRLLNSKVLHATLSRVAAKYDASVIGGGDLNAPSDSDAMRYLVAQGWRDAQDTALVSPREFQTDHYDPRRDAKGVYHGVPAVRGIADRIWSLDHVFYDPATIAVSRFDLDITPEACALSDHHPIVADFDLRQPSR